MRDHPEPSPAPAPVSVSPKPADPLLRLNEAQMALAVILALVVIYLIGRASGWWW